jgi:hypothetical protein
MKKILLLVLGLSLTAPAITIAQNKVTTVRKTRVVKVRPNPPKYTKVVSPGTKYVYVTDDWTWNDGTNQWVWNGNRWVVPPPAQVWVPGHWTETSTGWEWTSGYWK